MNTIGNQTGSPKSLGEAAANLKGTSGMSTGGKGASAAVGANVNAIRQTAQITGNMILSQMKPGSSFAGDIIDVCGNAIKLLLSGEKMLNATATDVRNLNIGDHIIFNVSSNNGSSVVIKPVKVNHFNTNMLLRALEAAEIPATEKNKNIIRAMMEHEMPIDKNSVMEMMKKVEVFKTENPQYIVSMEKHGIPLTQENLEQFGAYKGYEHRIMSQAETIANDIPSLLSEFSTTEDSGKAVSLAKGLINIFNDNLLHSNEVLEKNNFESNIKENVSLSLSEKLLTEPQMNDTKNLSEADALYLKSVGLIDDVIPQEIGMSTGITENTIKEPITLEQVIGNLETLKGDELKMFLECDEFKEFIKDKVERSFEININRLPTDGEEAKDMVKKLYENLDKKTEALLELLQHTGEGHSKLAQTASNMRNNMQFMQDLSQMASYIQLPVKFNEGKAHSELYVFNRKKGMPVDKDVITAFLHLDLDSLGATDINITLERKNITTQFSLSDEESIRIVEKNLYILKDRLEKKGYVTSFTVDTKATDNVDIPFDNMLETDKPQISIKRYSFDVRA